MNSICEGVIDITLKSKDLDRGCVFYDVGKLFDKEDPVEPTAVPGRACFRSY